MIDCLETLRVKCCRAKLCEGGVGVGVVNEVREDLRRTKNFRFNQIGGLDKLSKMIVIGR